MDRTNAERQRRYRTKLKAAAEAHRDGVDLHQDDRILSSTASFCWTIRVLRRRISALSQVQAAEYEARAKQQEEAQQQQIAGLLAQAPLPIRRTSSSGDAALSIAARSNSAILPTAVGLRWSSRRVMRPFSRRSRSSSA